MKTPGPPNPVARRAMDELADFSGETEIPKRMKFFKLQQISEAWRFINLMKEVYDNLVSLRDDKRAEHDKLMALNELIDEAKEDISRKETHIEISDAAISSYGKCMDLLVFNEYETYGGNLNEEVVGAQNWLDMVPLYCRKFMSEHREFAIKMNRLCGEMIEACQYGIAFVRELESVAGVIVMAKNALFLKEMVDKEGSREWQLHDLGKEAKERALEIELFVQKLMRDESS
ncbi:hypothetical protein Tco_0848485 [Tanacetum coccineum]